MNLYWTAASFAAGMTIWLTLRYFAVMVRGPAVIKGERAIFGIIFRVAGAFIVSAGLVFLAVYAYRDVAEVLPTRSESFLYITIGAVAVVAAVFVLLAWVSYSDYRNVRNKHIFYCIPFGEIKEVMCESAGKLTNNKPVLSNESKDSFTLTMDGIGKVQAKIAYRQKVLVEFMLPSPDFRGKFFLEIRAGLQRRIKDSSAPINFG